jgi:arylsulfatase A-like enzyme
VVLKNDPPVILSGDMSQFEPVLFENHNRMPHSTDPNYHLSTEIADKLVAWLQKMKAIDPDRPFFLSVAPTATHAPHQWIKRVASRFGGTRDPLIISWPAKITDKGGLRTPFHHVMDIMPTVLEAAGIQAPDILNGTPQKLIEGISLMTAS